MPIQAGIGFHQHPDASVAALEAAQQAREQLQQERIDLAFVFSTVHYDPKSFLPLIYEALDQTKLLGCSTSGLIFSDRIETRGIAVLALNSDSIKFEINSESHLHLQNLAVAGKSLGKNCITDFGQQHRKFFLVLGDGLLANLSVLAKGIQQHFGENFCVLGAGSSDNFRRQNTYQFYKNTVMSKGAVGLLVGGQVTSGLAIAHGWHPLGRPRTINRARDNVVQSIDGKKAVDFYEEFFPNNASSLKDRPMGQINLRYPLGMNIGRDHEYLLRNILTTLDDGSLICQDTFQPSAEVHMMMMNVDSCLRAAERAAQQVNEHVKSPRIALLFESAARFKILGRQAHREIKMIQRALTPSHMLGIYTYGELYPYSLDHHGLCPLLQNNSIMILGLS